MPGPRRRLPTRPMPSVIMSAATTATRAIAATTDGSNPNHVTAGTSSPPLGSGLPVPLVPPVPPPSSLAPGEVAPSGEAPAVVAGEASGEAPSEKLGTGLATLGWALGTALGCGAPLAPGTATVVKFAQRY